MRAVTNVLLEYKMALTSAHRNVRMLFLANFIAQIGNGFSQMLYNLYIKSLGLPDTVAGACVSAGSIAGALFLVPAGIMGDRFGRKRMVIAAGALGGLLLIVQAFLRTPWLMVTGQFVSGMVGSVIWVSILPMLAENTEKEERLHLFSINFGLTLLSQVLGSFISGAMADALGRYGLGTVWSLRATLLTGAILSLIGLIPYMKIQESGRVALRDKKKSGLKETMSQLKKRRPQLLLIGKFTFAQATIGFGAGLVIPYLNLYFADRFHMPKSGIGLVIGLAQALTALTMFIGPMMSKRFGAVRSVVGLQLLSIPFLLITGWATSLAFASVAVIFRQALMNSANPIQDSVMMALVDDDLKGFSVSCGQTMFTLGWAIMGPISTNIVRIHGPYMGYSYVFTGTAILYLIGASFYFWAFRKHEHAIYSTNQDGVPA